MKEKQTYFVRASFALLVFVMLGYLVTFYPEALVKIDSSVQAAVRGSLPKEMTFFFKNVTMFGNTAVQIFVVLLAALFFYVKKWYSELGLMMVNGVLAALFIAVMKNIYQRPRPSITHLVHAGGYSFPSGHSMGAMLIIGSLLIIVHQRMQKGSPRFLVEFALVLLIALIGLSRIYLGVHYPSDVLAGFALGFGIINFIYPFYNQKRFELRFQSKQN